MAATPEGQGKDRAAGGGAVNDLTPPGERTMQYLPMDQKTIQQGPPTGFVAASPNTVVQPQNTLIPILPRWAHLKIKHLPLSLLILIFSKK